MLATIAITRFLSTARSFDSIHRVGASDVPLAVFRVLSKAEQAGTKPPDAGRRPHGNTRPRRDLPRLRAQPDEAEIDAKGQAPICRGSPMNRSGQRPAPLGGVHGGRRSETA